MVSSQHFANGKLKVIYIQISKFVDVTVFILPFPLPVFQIRCTARVHDIYIQSTEKSIDEERPKVISAASSANSNSITNNNVNYAQSVPYDQFALDVDGDKRDSFMTHIQGKLKCGLVVWLSHFWRMRLTCLKNMSR
jgi:hypothetical protein